MLNEKVVIPWPIWHITTCLLASGFNRKEKGHNTFIIIELPYRPGPSFNLCSNYPVNGCSAYSAGCS